MIQSLTCGFIGLGLIGGSLAKAVRKYIPHSRIYAYDLNPGSLKMAVDEGVCDLALSSIGEAFRDCDYLFLCAPVAGNDSNLLRLAPFISPDAILTDVGSVKTGIHKQVKSAGLSSLFIGGHPMAGSERFGYANSKAELLENAYYILTPSPEVPASKLDACRELISSAGALPLILDCEEHDYITACISHLPHIIASSLVNLVRDHDNEREIMKAIAAGGFKDITRIASSSPEMWQNICLSNRDNLSLLLSCYIDSLVRIKALLDSQDQDAVYRFFEEARTYRESFTDLSGGPIQKQYTLNVDIPDKAGALASIASVLAQNEISIKNIGIVHNREYEEGVLRIEFYGAEAVERSRILLHQQGYTLHIRTS